MVSFEEFDKEKHVLDSLRKKGIDERLLSNPRFIEDYVKNIEQIVENRIKFRSQIGYDYKSPLEIFKEYVKDEIENKELNKSRLETIDTLYGEKRETYIIREDGNYEYIEYTTKEIEMEHNKDNEGTININSFNNGVIDINPPSIEISIDGDDYLGNPGGEIFIGNISGEVEIEHTKKEKRIVNKITRLYDTNGIEQKKEIENIKIYDENDDVIIDSESTVIIATRKEETIHYQVIKTGVAKLHEPIEYEEAIDGESEKRINISDEVINALYEAKSLEDILNIKEKCNANKTYTPSQIGGVISPKMSEIKEVANEMIQEQIKVIDNHIDNNNHDENDDK